MSAHLHLMSPHPGLSACLEVQWVGSPAEDPRCAGGLDEVTCPRCIRTLAFRDHARRAAAANRTAVFLIVRQQQEIEALRAQVAALTVAREALPIMPGLAKRRAPLEVRIGGAS